MKVKTVWWIFIILWCTGIFYQSSRPASQSQKQSMFIVVVINHWASVIAGKEVAIISDHFVRKSAHGMEYFILGALLFNGFFTRKKRLKAFMLAIGVGILYAVSDEIHQFFVPGRTMKATDVLIDAIGVFFGAGLLYISAIKKIRR